MTAKPHIDYYFSTLSSFAYLGHWAFQDMIRRLDCTIFYKPVQLGQVFAASGGLGLGDRHPARLRNRKLELMRWRDKRGLQMNLEPAFFPTNPTLADCTVIALQDLGHDPVPFMGEIMRSVWVHEQDIANAETVASVLSTCDLDAQTILEQAQLPACIGFYEANTKAGIELDIIGSPTPVYQGEAFWGQDRFDMLYEAVESGRPPYQAG